MATTQVFGGVVVGKVDLDGAALARLRADELLLEALDEPPTPDLHHVVACLSTRERLAVHGADEVHHGDVSLRDRAVDRLDPREPLPQVIELLIEDLGRHLRRALADLELLVAPELRLRRDGDLDREAERL